MWVVGGPCQSFHMLFTDSNNALAYARYLGGTWSTSEIVTSPVTYVEASLAVAPDGSARVAYRSATGLQYASNAGGTWATEPVTATDDGDREPSLALDSHGTPSIAFWREGAGVQLATRNGGVWSTTPISSGAYDSWPSLGVDSAGHHDIAFWQGESYISYATDASGSWKTTQLTSWGKTPSLAIAPNGQVHIAFFLQTMASFDPDGVFDLVSSGSAWKIGQISDSGEDSAPQMAVTPAGIPIISFGRRTDSPEAGEYVALGTFTATHLALSGMLNPWTAGSTHSFKVTALDADGNVATGYTGTIHFTSSDPKAVLPADYTFTAADRGIHTFSNALKPGLTLKTVGTQWVRATDKTTGTVTGIEKVTVVLPAKTLRVTVATNPIVAGAAHSVTVTALDAGGKVATGYRGAIHFTSADPKAVLPADYTFTAADKGVHKFTNGVTLKSAGARSVTATDVSLSSIHGAASVTVTPGAARTLSVSVAANPFAAGSTHSVTVKALDAYGNTVTGYRGRIHFTSSDSAAVLPADYTFTAADAGVHKFTNGVILKTSGARSVTATDESHSSITGSQVVTVTPGVAKTLSVSVAANPFGAGSAHSVTIKALDAYGNVATGYVGTIHFTSSDGEAVLPGTYTFSGADAGTHKFTNGVTLNTAGSQSVTATDNSHSSITGTQTVSVN